MAIQDLKNGLGSGGFDICVSLNQNESVECGGWRVEGGGLIAVTSRVKRRENNTHSSSSKTRPSNQDVLFLGFQVHSN